MYYLKAFRSCLDGVKTSRSEVHQGGGRGGGELWCHIGLFFTTKCKFWYLYCSPLWGCGFRSVRGGGVAKSGDLVFLVLSGQFVQFRSTVFHCIIVIRKSSH